MTDAEVDALAAKFTAAEKSHAFEWLREYALRNDDARDTGYAYIMLIENSRLYRALARRDALLRDLSKGRLWLK